MSFTSSREETLQPMYLSPATHARLHFNNSWTPKNTEPTPHINLQGYVAFSSILHPTTPLDPLCPPRTVPSFAKAIWAQTYIQRENAK